jgi:hypothetical protein
MTRLILAHPFTDEQRRNLVTNPGAGIDLTGFTAATGGTGSAASLQRVTTFTPPGTSAYARATKTVMQSSGSSWLRVEYASVPVVAGTTYTFSAWGRYVNSGGPLTDQVIISWKGAGGAAISEVQQSSSGPAGTYARRSVTAAAPAGAITAVLSYGVTTAVVATRAEVSALLFEASDVLEDYFDGNTPDSTEPPIDYAWTGAENASTSTASVPTSSEQIQPALVLAPWTAGRQSRSILHEYMDDPASTRLTWLSPSPRTGEFDMLFATPAEAASAFDTFSTHQWFSYDGGGDATQAVDAFCVTPGGQPTYGHVASLARGEGTIAPVQRWHVLVPWTELS